MDRTVSNLKGKPGRTTELSDKTDLLRMMLDDRGIAWRDMSDIGGGMHVERTRFDWHGVELSCIWGYMQVAGRGTKPISYGFPDAIEVWDSDDDHDPVTMTVAEITQMLEDGSDPAWMQA